MTDCDHQRTLNKRPHPPGTLGSSTMAVLLSAWLAPVPLFANPQANAASTMITATGQLEVTMKPQTGDAFEAGRMTIEKRYIGDLNGTGTGQMLSARTAVAGSAGYVAIEHFTGTLEGRRGSFVLQHTGTMNRGTPSLRITIVPDSGSGDLSGISGTMDIRQSADGHSYELVYTFVSSPED